MDVKKAIETITKANASCATGDRYIVVIDRGWIFAGELSCPENDIYTLTNCVNVRKWEKGGFGALSRGAKTAGATLDETAPLKFHRSAMIFCVPIVEGWENE
jgi:hypothetical protein